MGSTDERVGDDAVAALRPDVTSWLLLNGPRRAVAALTAGAVFAFLLVVSLSGYSPLTDRQPVFYVFGALISGNLTIVTVVVSINQLLLSRELRTPTQLRPEIEGTIDFRRDIEEAAERVAPVEPLGFLQLLFQTTRQEAQRLGGLARAEADGDVADDVDRIVTTITRQSDHVDGLLRERHVGTFQVLSTTLHTNYAREIKRLRQIEVDHEHRLPPDVDDAIDDLVDRLRDIDVARQYLKSIYFQQELASLSRALFYTGLPSVAVVAATLLLFTAADGATVSRRTLSVLVPGVITIGLLPLSVLFSFILRTATVTRRTAAIVPFTTPTQEE